MKKLVVAFTFLLLLLLVLPVTVLCSNPGHINQSGIHKTTKHSSAIKLSDEMIVDIKIHAILLWASIGVLLPLGILTIRPVSNTNRERNGSLRTRIPFYVHAILQILSVALATAGLVLSVRKFENSFNNNHQRIGLALYAAIWIQAGVGLFRPKRGRKGRTRWYFIHWLLGTTISIVGIINIYTGFKAYHNKTSRSINLWNLLFTAQVILMAFFYLIQDKWEYMKKGVIIGNEPVHVTPSPAQVIHQSDTSLPMQLLKEPCTKSNALINYFN